MRCRILVMAGVVFLVGLMWVGGGWAMTFEEMAEEMKSIPMSRGTSLDMYFRTQVLCSGMTCMPLTEVCVSEGSLRPMDPSKKNMDLGKAPPGNQYSISVFKRFVSDSGDHIFVYERMVELPACK